MAKKRAPLPVPLDMHEAAKAMKEGLDLSWRQFEWMCVKLFLENSHRFDLHAIAEAIRRRYPNKPGRPRKVIGDTGPE